MLRSKKRSRRHERATRSKLDGGHARRSRRSILAAVPLGTTDHLSDAARTEESYPTAAPPSDVLAAPGYRVVREIVRGSMGRGLAAHYLGLDRDIAFKDLLPAANTDRFVRASKIAVRLSLSG